MANGYDDVTIKVGAKADTASADAASNAVAEAVDSTFSKALDATAEIERVVAMLEKVGTQAANNLANSLRTALGALSNGGFDAADVGGLVASFKEVNGYADLSDRKISDLAAGLRDAVANSRNLADAMAAAKKTEDEAAAAVLAAAHNAATAEAEAARKAAEESKKKWESTSAGGRTQAVAIDRDFLSGTLDDAAKKLRSFHSIAAEEMRKTVVTMRDALGNADLGEEEVEKLQRSVLDFLTLANRLPPGEFGQMQDELARMVAISDRLNASVRKAESSEVKFKVDVEGADEVDGVRRKLEAIGGAKEAIKTVEALSAAIDELPSEELAAVKDSFADVQSRLESGDLGERNLKAAAEATERLAKAMRDLRPDAVEKLGPTVVKLKDQLARLRESAQKLPAEFRRGFDLSDIASQFGIHTNSMSDGITKLISRFTGIKMGATAFAAVSTAIAGGIAMLKIYAAKLKELKKERLDLATDTVDANLAAINKALDARKYQSSNRQADEDNRIETERKRRQAEYDATEALAAWANRQGEFGIRDAGRIFDLQTLAEESAGVRQNEKKMADIEADDQSATARAKAIEDDLAALGKAVKSTSKEVSDAQWNLGNINEAIAAKERMEVDTSGDTSGMVKYYSSKFSNLWNMSLDELKAAQQKAQASYDAAVEARNSRNKEIAQLERDAKDVKAEREAIAARRRQAEYEKKSLEQDIANRKEIERIRREQIAEERRRVERDRAYSNRLADEELARSQRNEYGTGEERKASAKEVLEDRKADLDEVLKELEEFGKAVAGMTEQQIADNPELSSRRSDIEGRVEARRSAYRVAQQGLYEVDERAAQDVIDFRNRALDAAEKDLKDAKEAFKSFSDGLGGRDWEQMNDAEKAEWTSLSDRLTAAREAYSHAIKMAPKEGEAITNFDVEAMRADRDRARELEDRRREDAIADEEFDRERRGRYGNYNTQMSLAQEKVDKRRGDFDEAKANLDAFMEALGSKGESQLTENERSERDRLEAQMRARRAELREAERAKFQLEAQGDARETAFQTGRGGASNRLVSLGIAGGTGDWAKSTAMNTKLTAQGVAMIAGMLKGASGARQKLATSGWSVVNM